jgi:hypothetical protein
MKITLKKILVSFTLSTLIFLLLFLIDNLPKDQRGNLFFFSIGMYALNLISSFLALFIIIYFFISKKRYPYFTIFIAVFSLVTFIAAVSIFKFGGSLLFYQMLIQSFLSFISLSFLLIVNYRKQGKTLQ